MSEELKAGDPANNKEASEPKQTTSTKEGQSNQPVGSPALPNATHIHPPPKNTDNANSYEKTWVERWMPYCEFWGIVFGIIVAIVICGQYWEMHQTNKLMQQTLVTDSRAWVAPFEMTVERSSRDTNMVGFRLFFKNTGKTPALNVSEAHGFCFFAAQVPTTNLVITKSSMMLAPDGASFIWFGPYDYHMFDEPVDNPPCVYGTITYDDIFGIHHWTDFCWIIDRNYTFRPAPVHNSCDEAKRAN